MNGQSYSLYRYYYYYCSYSARRDEAVKGCLDALII